MMTDWTVKNLTWPKRCWNCWRQTSKLQGKMATRENKIQGSLSFDVVVRHQDFTSWILIHNVLDPWITSNHSKTYNATNIRCDKHTYNVTYSNGNSRANLCCIQDQTAHRHHSRQISCHRLQYKRASLHQCMSAQNICIRAKEDHALQNFGRPVHWPPLLIWVFRGAVDISVEWYETPTP